MPSNPSDMSHEAVEFRNPDPDAPLRESIVKLCLMVTDRAAAQLRLEKITTDSPEYIGLSAVCTDEMAEVALAMGKRKPRTLPEIAELTGKSGEYLEPLLQQMAVNGVIEYNWENPRHEKQYMVPMFVPGSAEFTNMNMDLLTDHPELGRFFERMSRLPLEGITQLVPPGGAGIGMHVIPVERAIEMENTSVPIEHISHWLDKYDGKYAASPCSCRRSRMTFDEGCADDPEGWCIAVGDMADYVVETNKGGRYITREEALEIFQQAEDNGFVHQITNIDGENKIFAICNCNVNVCYALRTSQLFNTPNMSRSAYVARVTKENCVACGRCVETCPAGAVKLGRKLCRKDGSDAEYPKTPLPSEVPWSRSRWTEDYRDRNRINCYDTGTSPCKSACPAHIAVQGYLKLAAQGRYQEALALIKKENPLPAVCGRICNRRCEDACTRGRIDEAIAIDEVKKFLADLDLHADTRYIPKKVVPSLSGGFPEKIAVIGGGPAGLSCAFYLAEKGYRPTVFERNERPGGMLVYGVPSFKLEKEVVQAEIDIIGAMGVEFRTGIEVGRDVTLDELRAEGYKAFYLAIGCQGGRALNVPGEDADGVLSAVDFLHQVNSIGNSIGACPQPDFTGGSGTDFIPDKITSPRLLAGDAVVVGGGNVAIDAARCALRCGVSSVTMLCLEPRDDMPASEEEIEEALGEGIQLSCGWGPKEILAEGEGADRHVTGIVFKRCLSVKDAEGRFRPVYDENDTITIPCRNVILAIGQSIVWGDLLKGSRVELGRGQGAVADALTYQTAEPDIFVGGDVYTGPKFAIDAIAAGKEAAVSIHRFVQPHSSLTIGRNRRDFHELDKDDIHVESYDNTARQVPGKRSAAGHTADTAASGNIHPSAAAAGPAACAGTGPLTFREEKLTFTEEQVRKETARCLGCGASVVDENRCVGCGVCTTRCSFDAIHLYREHPECSTMVPSEDKFKYIIPYALKQEVRVRLKPRKN